MSGSLVLALDAMGGDNAPDMVVAGANVARVRYPDLQFRLFGNSEKLEKLLRRFPKLSQVATVIASETVIEASEKPSQALRRGRQSSMRLAIDRHWRGSVCQVKAWRWGMRCLIG